VPAPDEDGGDYTVPIGEAKVTREGEHLTLIAYSRMTSKPKKPPPRSKTAAFPAKWSIYARSRRSTLIP
jgi:hypothetical protein